MEGVGLRFTQGIGRCLLHHSSLFGPMAGSSETLASPNSPYGWFGLPPASHPPPPPAPPLPPAHPL